MVGVRRASAEEIPALAAVLAGAFRDDRIFEWTHPGPRLEERIRRYFEAFDRPVAEHGWLWTAGEGAAVAVWEPPGADAAHAEIEATAGSTVRELTGDGGARYEEFWEWVESRRPAEPHWYLDQIAVEAGRRGEGLGVALVEHGLGMSRAGGTPAFLMTSRDDNVPFYERRGFTVSEAAAPPDGGPHLWFMRWDGSPSASSGSPPTAEARAASGACTRRSGRCST